MYPMTPIVNNLSPGELSRILIRLSDIASCERSGPVGITASACLERAVLRSAFAAVPSLYTLALWCASPPSCSSCASGCCKRTSCLEYLLRGPLMVILFRLLTSSLLFAFPLFVQFSAPFSAVASPLAQSPYLSHLPAVPESQPDALADASAHYKQAYSLLYDTHATPDDASAIALLRSSAAEHFAPAQFLLGYLYEHGRGVSVDFALAAENYRAAAEQGHAGAQNNLGGLYQYGHGVSRDIARAFDCYRASAQHGNAMGQYNLATFYRLGYGTAPDMGQAVKWFRAAAEHGLAAAQANRRLRRSRALVPPRCRAGPASRSNELRIPLRAGQRRSPRLRHGVSVVLARCSRRRQSRCHSAQIGGSPFVASPDQSSQISTRRRR
jgi:hypothetical protein